MARYQWRPDGPKQKVDAQVFGETVERIAGDLESVKPEDIVEAARNKKSPIHELFEWRNDHAAEMYRRHQARNLVGALQLVRVQIEEGPTLSNRAFFSVKAKERTGYMPISKIQGDADLRKQMLETARGELESYIRKFGGVMALGSYVPRLQLVLDEMRDEADSLTSKATRRTKATVTDIERAPTTTP